jgi:hypothetical protein
MRKHCDGAGEFCLWYNGCAGQHLREDARSGQVLDYPNVAPANVGQFSIQFDIVNTEMENGTIAA